MNNKIIVVGIGPGSKDFITPIALKKIHTAKFLVGGHRALNDFASKDQITCGITRELDFTLKFIREKISIDNVVVMVSGDPGYHSLLDFLKENFESILIEVIPSISAIQLAFARILMSWHSAKLLSFHGCLPNLDELNFSVGKILGLLTDAKYNSATISRLLMGNGWPENSLISIFERLSYPDEKISTMTLKEAVNSPVMHCILIVR